MYPVKWYKDNGNVYKDYQLNTTKFIGFKQTANSTNYSKW